MREWARRLGDPERSGVTVNAMHPGWADTPGIEAALPGFSRVMGPLLRTAVEGADTIVWLATDPEAATISGELFLDRRPSRSIESQSPACRRPSGDGSGTWSALPVSGTRWMTRSWWRIGDSGPREDPAGMSILAGLAMGSWTA